MRRSKLVLIFVILPMYCTTVAYSASSPAIVIKEMSISSIRAALMNKQITCEQLISSFIARIKKYNLSVATKPPINAIAKINVNAIAQARHLDQTYNKNVLKKPLYCIPILLKDNIDSYDSPSSSGSISMLGNQPTNDAFLVARLREAGAILIGKGTMDEFASGISGISSGNGRTGNVYDTSKNSGGSSSGPAAAVSANFATIGIGTDNSGSIRIPAAFNGVYGLRPSMGLISQRGIFPRGNMDGVAGPIARSLEDLVIVLDIIAKSDAGDAKTLDIIRPTSYSKYLKADGLQGKRIGVVRKFAQLNSFANMPRTTRQIMQQTFKTMKTLGATIIDNIDLSEYDLHREFNEAGEVNDINAYLASFPAARKNYQDICQSNRSIIFGNENDCLMFIKSIPKKYGSEYYQAMKIFLKNKMYVEKIMKTYHLDALLVPVSSMGSATYDSSLIANEILASNAGLPALNFNVGFTSVGKMPIGVEIIGKKYAEGTLIEIADGYEQHSAKRILPVMPEENDYLATLNDAQYNNLLTTIGYETYKNKLQNNPKYFSDGSNSDMFRKIIKREQDKVRKNGAYQDLFN